MNNKLTVPILNEAFDMVKAFGSPEASSHAAQIQHFFSTSAITCDQAPANTTLSEMVEEARKVIKGAKNYEDQLAAVESLPDCAEKHYMLSFLALGRVKKRSIPDVAREEVECAWSKDQKNPVYEELMRMIHEELSEVEKGTRHARSKQRGIVRRFARRAGVE